MAEGTEIEIQAAVSAAELRRLKRTFLKVATGGLESRLRDGAVAAELFVDYLRSNLTGAL